MHFLSHLVDSLVLVASKCVRSSATYHIFLLTYSVRRKKHYYVLVKYKKSRLKRSAHHRKDKRDFSKSRRIHLRFRFDHLNYLHGTFLWNKAQLEESCLFFSYSRGPITRGDTLIYFWSTVPLIRPYSPIYVN